MTLNTSCERQAFGATHDIAQNIISVDSTENLSAEVVERFLSLFNRYGFVVWQTPLTAENERANLMPLSAYFGQPVVHNRASNDGVLVIDATKPVDGYLGSMPEAHPLHTDGALLQEPEHVLTLKCIREAEQGGMSLLASGKAGFDYLAETCPDALPGLMADDAVTIERAGDRFHGPVFRKVGDRIHFRFRMDDVANVVLSAAAEKGYRLLSDFYEDPANRVEVTLRPGQILTLDNRETLHGRTDYRGSRRLLRRNYDGTGALTSRMLFGFKPAAQVA